MNNYELKDTHFTMTPITLETLDGLISNGWLDAVSVEGKACPDLTKRLKPFMKGKVRDINNGHYLVVTPIFLNDKIRTSHEYILYKIHSPGSPCKYDTASYRYKAK